MLASRAWNSLGNGALFTNRIRPATFNFTAQRATFHTSKCLAPTTRPPGIIRQNGLPPLQARRLLQTSAILRREAQTPAKPKEKAYKDEAKSSEDPADEEDSELATFKRTEKAAQASKVNLSAKLSSGEGKDGEDDYEESEVTEVKRIGYAPARSRSRRAKSRAPDEREERSQSRGPPRIDGPPAPPTETRASNLDGRGYEEHRSKSRPR